MLGYVVGKMLALDEQTLLASQILVIRAYTGQHGARNGPMFSSASNHFPLTTPRTTKNLVNQKYFSLSHREPIGLSFRDVIDLYQLPTETFGVLYPKNQLDVQSLSYSCSINNDDAV